MLNSVTEGPYCDGLRKSFGNGVERLGQLVLCSALASLVAAQAI